MTTPRTAIEPNTYTMSFKNFKRNGVKMRQLKVYQNGKWIYKDEFKPEDREKRELWAQKFVQSMRIHDTKLYLEQLESMKGF